MTDADADPEADADAAWFAGDDPVARVRGGSADAPADWPTLAVDAGVAGDRDDYYRRLKEATTGAARDAVRERERADDRQLLHAVRAMDDITRILLH